MRWLWDNKEWLFSGVAVAAVGLLYRFVFRGHPQPSSNSASTSQGIFIGAPQASGSNITQNVQIGYASVERSPSSDTTYLNSPTPSEILAHIEGLPPYQRARIKDSYLGLKVRWRLEFSGLEAVSDTERRIPGVQDTHDLQAGSTENCLVYARLNIERFPRLKVLHSGTPIQLVGEISFVSDDGCRFRLKDASVVFDGSAAEQSIPVPVQTSRHFATWRDSPESWVAEVRFEYLPDRSPEQEGWELVMDQGNVRPVFSVAADGPEPNKCLCVDGKGYRLDYRANLADKGIESVHCSAVLKNADLSTIYAHVQLRSKTQLPSSRVWLAHRHGARDVAKLDNGEWTVKDPGTVVRANWRSYEWSLPEEVDRTFGTDGPWVYEKLVGIRLRGPLSLTPIRFK